MRDSTGVDLLGKLDGRNSGPVDMANIPLFIGFHTCLVVSRISSNSSTRLAHRCHRRLLFDLIVGPCMSLS